MQAGTTASPNNSVSQLGPHNPRWRYSTVTMASANNDAGDFQFMSLDAFVSHVGGPDNAAQAIETSWIAAKLISEWVGRFCVYVVFCGEPPNAGYKVCPTYVIENLNKLRQTFNTTGIPDVIAVDNTVLCLGIDDILFPPSLDQHHPSDKTPFYDTARYADEIHKANDAISSDIGSLLSDYSFISMVYVTADADGVYLAIVVPRSDVWPASFPAPFPTAIKGIPVRLLEGAMDLC